MSALNIAYEETERRGIVMQYLIATGITIGAIFFCFAALGLVAAVPVVIDFLPMSQSVHDWLELIRWPALAFMFLLALGFLYRFGPDRSEPSWELVSPGAAVAMVLWLIASSGFALYVESIGSYDQTYGSLGAAVVLLMWFYLSAFSILIGAELNNVCDRRNRERPAG
jgi:membrane protein